MIVGPDSEAEEPAPRTSDEELLGRYRDLGHPEDFNELVRRFEKEIYRYLARYLGDRSLAEDVFQNTFLQLHLKRGLYEQGRRVRPWLYSIATHQAVDALRKIGRHATVSLDQSASSSEEPDTGTLIDLLVQDSPGPLAELEEKERQQWVRDAVARLPDALRQTLILAYHQDLKYREIADLLKIPVGTVKSRLHSAIAKLQDMAEAQHTERA